MKTILALVVFLISSVGVNAQHRWSGHMKENQAVPNRPPSAVCGDGTLGYEKVPGEDVCKGHKGIKTWVKNQYLGLDDRAPNGVKILTVAAPTIKFVPEKENVPEYWLKPIETDIAKSGGTKVISTQSPNVWFIKLKKF